MCIRGRLKIVGDRSVGASVEVVAELAQAALDGLGAGGVAGVVKHMPGHGRAEVDSHARMPVGGASVSYTHLTLPTRELVEISVVAVSFTKKKKQNTKDEA